MYAYAHIIKIGLQIIDCSTLPRGEEKEESNAKLHGTCTSNNVRAWQSNNDMQPSTDVTQNQHFHSRRGGAEPGTDKIECNAEESKAV